MLFLFVCFLFLSLISHEACQIHPGHSRSSIPDPLREHATVNWPGFNVDGLLPAAGFRGCGGAARGCSHLVFEHRHALLPGVGAPSSPQHCGGEGGPSWLLSGLMEVEVCLTQGLRSAKSQFHRGAKPPAPRGAL